MKSLEHYILKYLSLINMVRLERKHARLLQEYEDNKEDTCKPIKGKCIFKEILRIVN